MIFEFGFVLNCCVLTILIFELLIFAILKSRRRALANDEDPRNYFFNILDMNFMSIKKHELEIWYSFYFQVRESPTTLNIPTPTPAPDRGGPVACLGGQKMTRLLVDNVLGFVFCKEENFENLAWTARSISINCSKWHWLVFY